MRSNNPALNDKVFEKEIAASRPGAYQTGWAAPDGSSAPPVGTLRPTAPPAPDSLSPWQATPPPPTAPGGYDYAAATPPAAAGETMRVSGVATASGVLLVVLVAVGWFGWQAVKVRTGFDALGRPATEAQMPAWLFPVLFLGLGLAILTILKPKLARFTAVFYAAAEGALLGAISHMYEAQFNGIVLQAVGLTIGVFLVMLFLYSTRIIRVTNKFRTGVIAATGAIFLVYMVSIVAHLFGANIPFIHDAGPIGIGFSLLVVGLAAMNLMLDFDFIERGAAAGAPRYMEWYGAFGLLVTLVWLYLELLRLLSKLQRR